METMEILKRWALNLFYRKREYTPTSTGAGNAYQPVVTSSNGRLDPSLIKGALTIDTLFANGGYIVGAGKGVYVSGPTYDGVRFISGLVGFNVTWNGTNYIVGGDGGSNGGTLLLAEGTGETWYVYTFPSTGIAAQTITPAGLAAYRQLLVNATSVQVLTILSVGVGASTATLDVARGTGASGTAVFRGTSYQSHFNYSTSEETYIRGGKAGAIVHINDNHNGNVDLAQGGGNVILTSGGGRVTAGGSVGTAWNGLTFGSGWANFAGGFQTGQTRNFGDLVFTRGLVFRSSGAGTLLFTYPVGQRPPSGILISPMTNTGIGRIDVGTDGTVNLVSGGAGWVNLDDIPPFSTAS